MYSKKYIQMYGKENLYNKCTARKACITNVKPENIYKCTARKYIQMYSKENLYNKCTATN